MRAVFGVSCNECPRELVNGIPRAKAMIAGYQEGPLYEMHCPAGHPCVVLLTNPKHEIVFQMAAFTLLDRYYSPAILGFTTSLEVFWYFAMQCILASKGVTPLPEPKARNTKQLFEERWEETFKTDPPVLHPDDYDLRNRIIHEGYIPDRETAFAFGNKALDLIVPAMIKLRWDLQLLGLPNAVALAEAAIIGDGKKRSGNRVPLQAIQDAMILHDNESLRDRRLEFYMGHLRKVDALFRDLAREYQQTASR